MAVIFYGSGYIREISHKIYDQNNNSDYRSGDGKPQADGCLRIHFLSCRAGKNGENDAQGAENIGNAAAYQQQGNNSHHQRSQGKDGSRFPGGPVILAAVIVIALEAGTLPVVLPGTSVGGTVVVIIGIRVAAGISGVGTAAVAVGIGVAAGVPGIRTVAVTIGISAVAGISGVRTVAVAIGIGIAAGVSGIGTAAVGIGISAVAGISGVRTAAVGIGISAVAGIFGIRFAA